MKSSEHAPSTRDDVKEVDLPAWMNIQITLIGILQKMIRRTPGLSLLDYPLRYASVVGSGVPALAQSVVVLWTLDSAGSILVGRILVFNIFVVGFAKSCVLGLRPYKCSKKRLEHLDPNNEVSGGFPSGHTSSSASLALGYLQGIVYSKVAMEWFSVEQMRVAAVVVVLFVAFSRVYTAAHFFHDLAGGFAISFALAGLFDTLDLLSRTSDSLMTCNMLLLGLMTVGIGRLWQRVQPNGKVLIALIFESVFALAAALGLFAVQMYLHLQGQTSVKGHVLERWDEAHTPLIALARVVFGSLGVLLGYKLAEKLSGVSKHSALVSWRELFVFFFTFALGVFWGYVIIMELTSLVMY